MSDQLFERSIITSPHEYPTWELAATRQTTGKLSANDRIATTPAGSSR